MRRALSLALVTLASLVLSACEGMFDDADGLPHLTKRKPKKSDADTDRATRNTPRSTPPPEGDTGWQPVDGAAPTEPSTPPPSDPSTSAWQPVDPAPPPPPPVDPAPPLPPAPPPGTYQPAVPRVGAATPLPAGHQAAGTSADDPLYRSLVGAEPLPLAPDGTWLTKGVAPTLAGMRGQVVFLMFAFQTCPSCAQMTPYLKQWQDMYGPQGLSVVYVNNGRMAKLDDAKKAIQEQGLRFAYLHDAEGSSLNTYGIRAFPTAYVIDRSGKVVWEGTPLAVEAQLQELLVGLLAQK